MDFDAKIQDHACAGLKDEGRIRLTQDGLSRFRFEQVCGAFNALSGGPDDAFQGHDECGKRALHGTLGRLCAARDYRDEGGQEDQPDK